MVLFLPIEPFSAFLLIRYRQKRLYFAFLKTHSLLWKISLEEISVALSRTLPGRGWETYIFSGRSGDLIGFSNGSFSGIDTNRSILPKVSDLQSPVAQATLAYACSLSGISVTNYSAYNQIVNFVNRELNVEGTVYLVSFRGIPVGSLSNPLKWYLCTAVPKDTYVRIFSHLIVFLFMIVSQIVCTSKLCNDSQFHHHLCCHFPCHGYFGCFGCSFHVHRAFAGIVCRNDCSRYI